MNVGLRERWILTVTGLAVASGLLNLLLGSTVGHHLTFLTEVWLATFATGLVLGIAVTAGAFLARRGSSTRTIALGAGLLTVLAVGVALVEAVDRALATLD